MPLLCTGGRLCPVSAYIQHVQDFPSTSEVQPGLMFDTHEKCVALSHTFLVKLLKQLLVAIGESPELFAGYSMDALEEAALPLILRLGYTHHM